MKELPQDNRYIFLLQEASQELLHFLQELKQTQSFSPWLKTVVLRSLMEFDDRLRFLGEIELHEIDLAGYYFGLILVLQHPYQLPTATPDQIIHADQLNVSPNILVLHPHVPATLEEQWQKLVELIVACNS